MPLAFLVVLMLVFVVGFVVVGLGVFHPNPPAGFFLGGWGLVVWGWAGAWLWGARWGASLT